MSAPQNCRSGTSYDERVKKIGLIGGMSWESTAEYYRVFNEGVRERLGGLHSARLVVASVDFADVARMQAAGEWDTAGRLLADEARGLEAAGAEVVLIGANTMHLVADDVVAAIDVPLLHIADAIAAAVTESGRRRVALLGTAFTMEQPFLRERLEAAGLEVLVPDSAGRAVTHAIIYDELCQGIVRDESRDVLTDVVAGLVSEGAEGVILGCTELELILDPDNDVATVPAFPTARLHALAALDFACEGAE